MKRVAIVSDALGDVAGSYVATWLLARDCAAMGFEVTCFVDTVRWGGDAPALPFRVVRPPVRRGCRWAWPLRSLAWRAARWIRAEKPDRVVAVGMTRLARALLNTSIADRVWVWELTNAQPGNKFVDAGAVALLPRAAGVLSPSNIIDEAIRSTHGFKGTIRRLPFWVEDEGLPLEPSPGRFETDFLYLGRRDEEKGLFELIRALARVRERHPAVRLTIGGAGDAAPFEAEARRLGLGEAVRFHFFPSRAEVLAALARARYLVLPSWHEGYPLVLLEAAQRSVPFIATRVGSIPELCEGMEGARLIPPRDESALAETMSAALDESPARYATRREAAWTWFRRVSGRSAVDGWVRSVIGCGAHE